MKKKVLTPTVIVLAALLAIVCFAIVLAPWRFVRIKGTTGVSKEEFVRKMEKLDENYKTDCFSRNSEQLFTEAQQRGYNEYLGPALICIQTYESDLRHARNNLYNIFQPSYGKVHMAEYDTEEECIENFFDILDVHYGNFTIMKFVETWTPYEQEEYAINLYEKMVWIQGL